MTEDTTATPPAAPQPTPPARPVAWYERRWVSLVLALAGLALLLYGLCWQFVPVFVLPDDTTPETAELKATRYDGTSWVSAATFHGVERGPDGRLLASASQVAQACPT
jgi:hypothetical protein